MYAIVTYKVECPIEGCSKEQFEEWLSMEFGGAGASIESSNPLFNQSLGLNLEDNEGWEVYDE